MKREDKSSLLRNRIIEVSRSLFISQGYSATTMRQILAETGLTTGSLYHFFENKEDILKQIASSYLADLDSAITALVKDDDPVLHYALIMYFQLTAVSRSRELADVWHNLYSLWSIMEMICERSALRNRSLFGRYNAALTHDDWFARSLAINGVLHNIICENLNTGKIPLKERLRLVMRIAAALFSLPAGEIEPSITGAESIMKKKKLQLYSVKI